MSSEYEPECGPPDDDDMSEGWERDGGFDADGFQRKQACLGIVACPECGKDVELVAETEVWVEAQGGRKLHSGYGPATGVCCGSLIVDSWDGCFVYDLGPPEPHNHGSVPCDGCEDCDPEDDDDYDGDEPIDHPGDVGRFGPFEDD